MEDARLDVLASHLDGGRPAAGAAAGAAPEYDLLIVGGHICDPSSGVDGISDLAVKDGRVAAVGPELAAGGASAAEIFDATGLIVTPGLVDAHVHVRPHPANADTPSPADHRELLPRRCSTPSPRLASRLMSTAWGVAARPSAPLATPAAPITKGPH